jgi:hypothetical protein
MVPPLREEMTLIIDPRVRSIVENRSSYWSNSAAETGVLLGGTSSAGGITNESVTAGCVVGEIGRADPKTEEEEEPPIIEGVPIGEKEKAE